MSDAAEGNRRAILLMIGAMFFFTAMDATAKAVSQEAGPVMALWARYASTQGALQCLRATGHAAARIARAGGWGQGGRTHGEPARASETRGERERERDRARAHVCAHSRECAGAIEAVCVRVRQCLFVSGCVSAHT